VPTRDAIAYILHRVGCVHPFRFSRILALAELAALERGRGRLTDARYVAGPGVFYIEGIEDVMKSDDCFVKHEGDPSTGRRGCIEYRCQPPSLPEEARSLLDEAIEKAAKLSDEELNKTVVNHPLFSKLAS
jgi:hydroxypyruvate isomerase